MLTCAFGRAPGGLVCIALAALSVSACYSAEGQPPPLNRLYFPTGLALSPGATRLYVANSDFDLQYRSGTVQAYDLGRVRQLTPRGCTSDAGCSSGTRCDLAPTTENGGAPSRWCVQSAGPFAGRPCGALGEQGIADRLLYPGRCAHLDPEHPVDGGASLIVGSVGVGAFATALLYRSRPPAADGAQRPGGRLFLPVRGDATLTYIDVDDDSKAAATGFELSCGQTGDEHACDATHRRGDSAAQENTRDLTLPREPFGIDATSDGSALVLTHQTEGSASLFVNDWDQGSYGSGPNLEFVLTGLSTRPIGVAAVPKAASADPASYQPHFLVTFRDAAEVRLLRYFDDAAANPARPFLADDGGASITANSLDFDSRGIAIDDSARRAAETACELEPADLRADCLDRAADVRLDVYVANRSPATLLVGHTRSNSDLPTSFDAYPVSFGPSRVVVGDVIDRAGKPSKRVFLVCFDSRAIWVFDPAAREMEANITTGRGPHALAIDAAHGLAYLAHFTDSYLGVIDLDLRHASAYSIVLTLGRPTAPRASK